jgi:perosamine synthetase
MAPILELASSRGIAVVEDAAHSFPAQYKGREIGTIGDATAFSFYATKTITTGEGGMLVTDRDDIAERARIMSLHGMSRDAWKRYTSTGSWRYDVVAPGFKYNMTDMAAALGVSQLRRADWFLERRTAIARQYSAALAESGGIQPPVAREDVEHSWHLYVLRIRPKELRIDRDRFIQELDARGVRAGVHFIPLHQFTYYRETYGYSDAQFPVATKEFETMLSLPIYPSMTENDVSQVVSAVLDVADTYRR